MERENQYGLMVVIMKDNGKIIKLMVMGYFIIQMEIAILVNGTKTRQMVQEHLLIQMVQNILESGKMIISMVMEYKSGKTSKYIKENIVKVLSKVKGC